MASDGLVEHYGADDGEVRRFKEQDTSSTEFVVGGKKEAERSENDEREEVERWVEVGEAIGRGGFEDVDAVDVEIFLAGVADDTGEGI